MKRVPMRMCVGCGELKPKRELVRVVRTAEGEILLDPTGKKSGRGAYVCSDPACLQKAQKGRKLERALEHPISDEVYANLAQGMVK